MLTAVPGKASGGRGVPVKPASGWAVMPPRKRAKIGPAMIRAGTAMTSP